MAFLLPPFTKKHIAILGSITLLAYLGVLLLIFQTSQRASASSPAERVKVDAVSVQKDFKQPLAMAQKGDFDTALVNNKFLIIDIRPWRDYQQSHIEGAVSTPINQLHYALIGDVDHLVVYGQSESDLNDALHILGDMGIKKAYTLNDSLDSLKTKGYTITSQD